MNADHPIARELARDRDENEWRVDRHLDYEGGNRWRL